MLPTEFQFIWPSSFRGEYFFKSANQKQELLVVAMFVNGSGQNEQSLLEKTFHRCFLPSFTSFGWGVSEEKIKMWKVNGRQTPSDGKSSHCLWQGELKISMSMIPMRNFYLLQGGQWMSCCMIKLHYLPLLEFGLLYYWILRMIIYSDICCMQSWLYFVICTDTRTNLSIPQFIKMGVFLLP